MPVHTPLHPPHTHKHLQDRLQNMTFDELEVWLGQDTRGNMLPPGAAVPLREVTALRNRYRDDLSKLNTDKSEAGGWVVGGWTEGGWWWVGGQKEAGGWVGM